MERGTRALVALLVRDIGHGAAISDDAGRDGARWASSCWVMTVQLADISRTTLSSMYCAEMPYGLLEYKPSHMNIQKS
jgi:hypothetical protein